MSKPEDIKNIYETEAAVNFESNSWSDDEDENNSALNTLPIPEIDKPSESSPIAAPVPVQQETALRPGATIAKLKSEEKHYSTDSISSCGNESETAIAGGEGTAGAGANEGPSGAQADGVVDSDDPENAYTRLVEPTSTHMTQAHMDYYRTTPINTQDPNHPTSSGRPTSPSAKWEEPNTVDNVPTNNATVALVAQSQATVKGKPKAPLPPPVPGSSQPPNVLPRGPPPPIGPKPNSTRPLQPSTVLLSPPPTGSPPPPPISTKPQLPALLIYSNQQIANDNSTGGADWNNNPTASFQPQPTAGLLVTGDQIQVDAAAPMPLWHQTLWQESSSESSQRGAALPTPVRRRKQAARFRRRH